MRFEGVRFPYCRLKNGSVWLTAICAMAASGFVLLLTLAGFGMTAWLNDTSPTWEKRLDTGLVLWIVMLNMANLFLLPAGVVSGLNPMRVLDARGRPWTATLPVLVMGVGLLTSALATALIAISPTLTTAMAHWLPLLNITNAIAAATVCVSLWAGNRFGNASRDWLGSHGHRATIIVVALLCLASGVSCAVLTGSPDRWVPAVIATTIVGTTTALMAAWLVWRIGKGGTLL